MTQQPPPILIPPQKPPSTYSTWIPTWVAVGLSILNSALLIASAFFPENAPAEVFLAYIVSGFLGSAVLVIYIVVIVTELSRQNYKQVVERYTQQTGDTRYLPYVVESLKGKTLPIILGACLLPFLALFIAITIARS